MKVQMLHRVLLTGSEKGMAKGVKRTPFGTIHLIVESSLWFGLASKHFKRAFALCTLAKMLRILVSSWIGACEVKKTQWLDVINFHC
jgi:hypothetical protein